MPSAAPSTPPARPSTVASTRNCRRIAAGGAPSALRSPISRVRSVTETSMMFITPMPPTSSDSAAMPVSRMVSVRLTDVAVASSDCWLVMVKSAEVGGGDVVQVEQQRVAPPGRPPTARRATPPGCRSSTPRSGWCRRPAGWPPSTIGTMAWSSRLVEASEPAEASTPTTVNSMSLIVTVWPTASVRAEQLGGRLRTEHGDRGARPRRRVGAENRPSDRVRARTSSHDGDRCRPRSSSSSSDPAVNACELDLDRRDGGDVRRRDRRGQRVRVVDGQRRRRAEPAAHARRAWSSCRARRSAGCCPAS